jgi:dicarboxylate/amino acid:cation (Na+ or H+) symporter, DAACS family
MKSHHKLLLALVLGIGLGIAANMASVDSPDFQAVIQKITDYLFQPAGQLFLRLIFMVVVPLIGSAIILGVYELGKESGLGSVIGRTLGYTVLASSLSVFVGIFLVNIIKPGMHYQLDPALLESGKATADKARAMVAGAKPFTQSLIDLVPRNPLESATRALDGELLSVMVFAVIIGIALSRVARDAARGESAGPTGLLQVLQSIYDVSMKVVSFAIRLAPIAVFCIVFQTAFKHGAQIFVSLFFFVATVILGLLIQQLVVYSALLKWVAKRPPLQFLKQIREVLLVAFSTSSSNATLPKSLDTAEHVLGIRPAIGRFVLTVGATANQNGSALFEGVTVLFLAQVYGIDLSVGAQVQVVLMSIIAGIGTAGIPGGSLPMIAVLLQTVGIPPEGIGLILGVDRFLDMSRTVLNVSGDLVLAAMVDNGTSSEAVATV